MPYANLTNPQTLNLYSMVADDPESFADLDGHCCDVFTDAEESLGELVDKGAAEGAKMIAAAGRGVATAAIRISVGTTALIGLYAASPLVQKVGQSDANERAAIQQAQQEREEQNGGVDPQVSTSGAGARQGGGGLRYHNPGTHDPLSHNFIVGKTPLPSDAEAVFGTAISVTGRASGNGDLAYGINEKGQFYRYSGQNGLVHYSGTIASNKVPRDIRKQLQNQLKNRLKQQQLNELHNMKEKQ